MAKSTPFSATTRTASSAEPRAASKSFSSAGLNRLNTKSAESIFSGCGHHAGELADRDGMLPVDGVLMQLARAYEKAGKAAEARTAYKRVVDEFPDSLYVPAARTELTRLG